jgi:enamine deaminase RidA (YjgF/YER057c/UK114 family)
LTGIRRLASVPEVAPPLGPYCHAVIDGTTVYVSGQVGNLVGADDFVEQARQVYRNLQAVLEAAGSGLEQVTKMTVYLADDTKLAEHASVRREFMNEDELPASTLVVVAQLAHPRWQIEVEAVARVLPTNGD